LLGRGGREKPLPLKRDGWTDQERLEADGYATTCNSTLHHILAQLGSLEVQLDQDKRTSVELMVLLEIAAKIAKTDFAMDDNEFAITACEVFMRTG
jgi:hypothetical protein